MRVLFAVALIVFAIAGRNAASAADIPTERDSTYSTHSGGLGQRTAPLVVYDYHPGVVVRAYWLAPWRHRHYYPVTGEKPEIGRDEDLSATSSPAAPAETFYRSWSTSSAVLPELSRAEPPPRLPAPLK
jgi:hypothetical protein